ncbi:unnamed protein product [Phyllotreta striolata]|uniref:Uncharacterized protein n=1 Tax=Phyllotreta striolata TaxID=444603 RepID=A0A9N9XUN6_PHYSR|nr:unnamed protein product [Phyllotreta striolata]
MTKSSCSAEGGLLPDENPNTNEYQIALMKIKSFVLEGRPKMHP